MDTLLQEAGEGQDLASSRFSAALMRISINAGLSPPP